MAEGFVRWFRKHGGHIHQSISVAYSPDAGYYLRAQGDIDAPFTMLSASHSLALSYLNAFADDRFPMFQRQRHRFTPQALGCFYLMAQMIYRETSFWAPWLAILPAPELMTQAMFFEQRGDAAWLAGTDVAGAVQRREAVYRQSYHDGIEALRAEGVDDMPYTW